MDCPYGQYYTYSKADPAGLYSHFPVGEIKPDPLYQKILEHHASLNSLWRLSPSALAIETSEGSGPVADADVAVTASYLVDEFGRSVLDDWASLEDAKREFSVLVQDPDVDPCSLVTLVDTYWPPSGSLTNKDLFIQALNHKVPFDECVKAYWPPINPL